MKLQLKTSHGSNVCLYIYNNVKNPKAVVHIIHGASEHFTRYEDFIKVLNENGYICVGCDNIGHGESNHADKNYIFMEEKDAFEALSITKDYIEKEFKQYPIYLLGHSLGSFLARKMLIEYPKTYSKAIISGTTTMPTWLTGAAKFLAFVARVFRSPKGISPLLNSLGMDSFAKKMAKGGYLDPNNPDDLWICHNPKINKYYKESPICGEPFTVAAYQSMFKWCNFVAKINKIKKSDLSVPLFFISGAEDPLSNYGKDIKTTVDLYKKAGYLYVDSLVYDKMRHEVLNEIDNSKVYNDCLNFLNK